MRHLGPALTTRGEAQSATAASSQDSGHYDPVRALWLAVIVQALGDRSTARRKVDTAMDSYFFSPYFEEVVCRFAQVSPAAVRKANNIRRAS